MYTTGKDANPRKPVVTSLTHANREFANWVRANDLAQLLDADGLAWNLRVHVNDKPAKNDLKGRQWEISLVIQADVTAQEFVLTGTLDAQNDARLIEMIGDAKVPMRMRPQILIAHSLEEARTVFAQAVNDLRKRLAKQSLHATKRHIIGNFISDSQRFRLKP